MSEEPDPADSQRSAELHQEIAEAARLFPGYEILNLIGRGGMGTVYQARQTALDRLVAIKLMPIEVSVQHDFGDRFRREARAMARLNHPNIVSVHDFGQTAEGHLFIVMEYVAGSNLAELIQQAGLDLGQALAVAGQICAALGYAHGKGVVHRDVKPANVMVDPEGNVKVADFGLARVHEPTAEPSAGGAAGLVFGTPDYMAPEQMRHMDVDHRADIYSLGVITYEMLCGEVPRGVFQWPSQRIGCDPRIDQIVLKAMQQAPELRYQSTQEMAADIAAARTPAARARPVAGGRPPGRPAAPSRPLRPTAPKRPTGPPRRTGPTALQRASGPVGPVRPRPGGRVPPPAPKGSASLTVWVLVVAAVCVAVGMLMNRAPWKKTPPRRAPEHASTPRPTPPPAATPRRAPPIAVATPVPATPPPATPPAEPDLHGEVLKWLAETDAQQQEAYQKQATKPYEAGVANLRARYLAGLEAGLARAGAIEAAMWRSERQSFADAQTFAEDTAATPPAIRAMRAEYRQALTQIEQRRAATAKALFASYDAILVKDIGLLTQRQRLDDAALLQTKRLELAKEWLGPETLGRSPKPAPSTATSKPPIGAPADAVPFNGKWYRIYAEKPQERNRDKDKAPQFHWTWKAARDKCAQLGGRLAVVPDEATWTFLRELTDQAGPVWLGATDEFTPRSWRWIDGTPLKFTAWQPDHPIYDQSPRHYLHTGDDGWSNAIESGKLDEYDYVLGFVCEWKGK